MTDPILWTLVLLQIAMGGFDVLYHHEFTERLPWRPSAAKELALHAVRNGLYAILFAVFAWSEPHGIWALLLASILVVEVGITLWDFVEEDLTRRLPASERVTHTLLALNYGAILAFLLPILAEWSARPSGLVPVSYGLGSLVLSVAAAGVLLFALRDLAMRRRARALALAPAAELADALERRYRIVVTGGTGFVGARLVEALAAAGHAVIVRTRDPAQAARLRPPFTTVTDLMQLPKHLRIDAIVNLAGESVATGLWTAAKRRRIVQSRVAMADEVGRFMARHETPPKVLVAASAIGFYGLRGDEDLTEADAGEPCFSHESTALVERAADRAGEGLARVVKLRIGLVLGHEGGLLGKLLPAFDWCLGGRIGSGRQWMSWIERDDLVRLILHTIVTDGLEGPVNATAPEPVRNGAFAGALGKVLRRPAILPLPAWVVRLGLGDMGRELLLGGQRVLPEKVLASGFRFDRPDIASALDYCVRGPVATDARAAAPVSSASETKAPPHRA